MHFTIPRSTLLSAVQTCGTVAGNKLNPLMDNIAIHAATDYLTVEATDPEKTVSIRLGGVATSRVGSALVNCKKLLGILRTTSAEMVSVEQEKSAVHVTYDLSEFELATSTVDKFPSAMGDNPFLSDDWMQHGVKVLSTDLSNALSRVDIAAGDENTKYAIASVVFSPAKDGGSLDVVATDTKCLSHVVVQTSDGSKFWNVQTSCMVPPKTSALLRFMMGDLDEPVAISFDESRGYFRVADTIMTTRLVEGRFPPWREIIPKESKWIVTAKASEWNHAFRQASIMTDLESMRVTVSLSENKAVLTSQSHNGRTSIPMYVKYDGQPFKFHIDPRYATTFLRGLGDEEVDIKVTTEGRPILFARRTAEHDSYIVMPIS